MSLFIHQVLKIQYVRLGYLPNYPYHLISDVELFNSFLNIDKQEGYFFDTYPLLYPSLSEEYNALMSDINYHITCYLQDDSYVLPNWVYSYMLGIVIGPKSNIRDIHDMLVLMHIDNLNDIFTLTAAKTCYDISKAWIKKLSPSLQSHRSPTIFGEPIVLKSLRLTELSGI